MGTADSKLRSAHLVEVEKGEEEWFSPMRLHKGMIGDDHVPVGLPSSSCERNIPLRVVTVIVARLIPVPRSRRQHPARHFQSLPKRMA